MKVSVRGIAFASAVITICTAVGGCATQQELKKRIAGRWGPNPAIQDNDTNNNIRRQMLVLQYIVDDTLGVPPPTVDGSKHYWPTTSDAWLRVTKAGFNLGREDCEVYMDNLFRMARERQRNDSLLNAASLASNAILQATAVGKAVSIVGASFNMATGVNDAIYDSYLFAQAPGLIGEKVKDVQAAYRTSVESNPSSVQTPEDAYNAIQNYYSYCLPQSIEGLLLQKIADSNPAPAPNPPKVPTRKPNTLAPTNGAAIINQRVKLE